MPESYGKRQRTTARAKKVAAREERRLERKQRDADRAAGLIEAGTPIAANEPDDFPELAEPEAEAEAEAEAENKDKDQAEPEKTE